MRYLEFENIMSQSRMSRYLTACGNDGRKAMTLYRRNLKLTQKLFTVVSCFEIALRNKIDNHYVAIHGNDWLRNAAQAGGFFDNHDNRITRDLINETILLLNRRGGYTHSKLVAELGFGFWRFMFSRHQYRAGGQTLIRIMPNRPPSSPAMQYNANYVFNEIQKINDLRNRLAHHEPVCFYLGGRAIIGTLYAREHYAVIVRLFQWMDINEEELLYGLDHVVETMNEIDTM